MNMKKKSQEYLLLFVGISLLCGCASILNGYGTFVPDQVAEQNFESFQIDPDMNYYFSGSDVYPTVIMGLKKQYILDNDLWRPIKSDPKIFKDLITDMQTKAATSGQLQRGFALKSPDGQTIGVCYCPFKVRVRLKMGEDNKVVVYTPEVSSYPYDGGGRGARGR
jgi:hypothetical protein